MNHLKSLWANLTASLWFVPSVIVLGAILLAVGLIELSAAVDRDTLLKYPRLFGAGAEGSRGMRAAIGGSMMTVAGVTFSLTLAALRMPTEPEARRSTSWATLPIIHRAMSL